MKITVEKQPNCRATVRVNVPAEHRNKQRRGLVAYYSQRVSLPGFRPGKVPPAAVEKRFSQEIGQELERMLIEEGLREAVRQEKLEVLGVLGVSERNTDLQDQSFSFTAELSLAPQFELPQYKQIAVKLPRVEVSDGDVDHDLLHLRERYGRFEDVQRPAAMEDCVVVNYQVSLEGKPLNESVADAPSHLVSGQESWFLLAAKEDFLPGFYAGLVGIEQGGKRTLTLTPGDDFEPESLRGRQLQLEVSCVSVKQKTVPELDAAFLERIGGAEMTMEKLRDEVRQAIQRRREQAREAEKANQIIAHIAGAVEFDLPADVVNREAQRRTNDMAMRAMQQGVPQEELVAQQEQILSSAMQQASSSVKVSFILGEVARRESLSVEQEQLMSALAHLASRQKKSVKKFMQEAQQNGLIDRVREDLLLEAALQFLKDQAVVEETDPQPEACEQHPAH
jgi:trigger factor